MEPAIVLGFRQPPVVVSYWGFLPSGVFSVLCSHLERKVGARERESVRFNPIGGYTDDEYEGRISVMRDPSSRCPVVGC
jgi:hypothetical protein